MTISLIGFAVLLAIAFFGFPLGYSMMLVGFVGVNSSKICWSECP